MIASFNALPFSPPTQSSRDSASGVSDLNDPTSTKLKDEPINFLAALAALFPGILPQASTPPTPVAATTPTTPITSNTTDATVGIADSGLFALAPEAAIAPSRNTVAASAAPIVPAATLTADAPAVPVVTPSVVPTAIPSAAYSEIPVVPAANADPAALPVKPEKITAPPNIAQASALATAIAPTPVAGTLTAPPRLPVETAAANRRSAPTTITTTSSPQIRTQESFDAEITLPTTSDGTASFHFHRETLSAIAPTPAKSDSTDEGDADAPAANAESPHPSFETQSAAPNRAESTRPVPPLGEQVRVQIHDNLDQVRQTGRADLRMDLQPPELGRMRLHLTLQDDNLHIRLTVQDEGVKRLLDQQLEPLRVHFSEMGVSIGQFDVRSDGGSAYQNPEQNAGLPTKINKTAPAVRRSYMPAASSSTGIDVFA